MLGRIADTYEEEVDTAVAGLTALIEPLTIATMAVVVGTIVIAMFLPIVRIIQTLA
jgi:type IV pilus assembly protein PilC